MPALASPHAQARWLPHGRTLPEDDWRRRHRAFVIVLALHAPALFAFGLFMRRESVTHVVVEATLVAALAALAAWPRLGRRVRTVVASAGLVTCSAILVHLSGGYIEAHFHFFVAIALVSLYEDWAGFGVAVGYVAVHHGTVGTLDPVAVYNHAAGFASPWKWALIHAVFVLAESAALVFLWRMNEVARERTAAAQEELRRSERNLADFVETSAIGLHWVGPDGTILWANTADHEFLGYTRDAYVGRKIQDFHADANVIDDILARLAGGERIVDYEARLVAKDGSVHHVLIDSSVLWENGEFVHTRCFTRDITARKAAESELASARRQMAEAEKLVALGTLVSGVAHEIRTPLTYIANHVTLARIEVARALRAGELTPERMREVESWLVQCDDGVDRINDLVKELRRFASPQAPARAPFRVSDAVEEAIDLFRATHRSRARVVEDLGADALAVGNKPQIQQVVLNLLENASEAMTSGGVVRVATRAEDDCVEIVVQDDGPGIPADVQGRIFDPFFTTKPEGTGLGLSIVRRIVEDHNGAIRCESDPGAGATFIVRLPAADAAPRADPAAVPPISASPPQ